MKLIGNAFLSGRIDFTREDNPWAFSRIDSGMKQNQRDRIRMDPSQAPIELRSAEINGDESPEWMEPMETLLTTAEAIFLQFKSDVLRFRRAEHIGKPHQTFVTLGNQDEVDLYAAENWNKIRYLYAERRMGAFCFDVKRMISHKDDFSEKTRRIELIARQDLHHPDGDPQFTIDSTGTNASVDIIEWRGEVTEGEIGRYDPEDAHIELHLRSVVQPITFLHEERTEFHNHAYTFTGDQMRPQLDRVIKKRLAELKVEESEPEE